MSKSELRALAEFAFANFPITVLAPARWTSASSLSRYVR